MRIRDDAELDRYMNGSAAAVGRIMAPLIGTPERREEVARLGMAFQLANFVRDVREDWALDRDLPPRPARERPAGGPCRATASASTWRARSTAPARCSARRSGSDEQVAGRVRHGDVPGPRASTAASWIASSAPGLRRAARHDPSARPPAARSARRWTATRADVLICGASFAGLAVARELAGCGADVLLIDRYAIGERQTSACAVPEGWLQDDGRRALVARQVLPDMTFTTPHGTVRYRLPWRWAAFDYRTLCEDVFAQCDARFETAKVDGPHAASRCTPTAATCTRR